MHVYLATEDELSEAVGLRLLREHKAFAQIQPTLLRKDGSGYLRSNMDKWKNLAQHQLVVLLTDLDKITCPVALLDDWLGTGRVCPGNLIFRVAEREVEAWLMADHEAFALLMGKKAKLPREPDALLDPKRYLLEQARKAPRTVRQDLIAETGAVAKQGIGYNNCLVKWMKAKWCPQRAAERSPSLARARRALNQAAERAVQSDK
ncbi:DUF4276 family protein [Vandammella animalimorsus]|uniref:DUF4276 family protein n=1 Tax=Vandammella animalimorsus TaxID=2029117 RepID=UPI001553C645|nr:DUF4276 family protein [Vandammella animalimorsus]